MVNIMEVIKSMFGGQMAEGTYLASGFVMDKLINPDISNVIALLLGGIVNFLFQKHAFLKHSMTLIILVKYIIVDVILYTYSELSFINFEKKIKPPINNTILRICIGIIGFIFISFPLRKYFVFR